MKDFFRRMNDRYRQFMVGRYGTDDLSKFLLALALVLLVLSIFVRGSVLYLLALACLALTYYRMLSRDYAKRSDENRKFNSMTADVRKNLRIQKRRFKERKDYRFYKCPSCGQEVRVPRGKGHIRITCPKCRTQFDRTV